MNVYTFRFPLDYEKAVNRSDDVMMTLDEAMSTFTDYHDSEFMAFKYASQIHQDICRAEFVNFLHEEIIPLHVEIAASHGSVNFNGEVRTPDGMQFVSELPRGYVDFEPDMNWPLEENGDIEYTFDPEEFDSYSIDFSISDPRVAMLLKLQGFEEIQQEPEAEDDDGRSG